MILTNRSRFSLSMQIFPSTAAHTVLLASPVHPHAQNRARATANLSPSPSHGRYPPDPQCYPLKGSSSIAQLLPSHSASPSHRCSEWQCTEFIPSLSLIASSSPLNLFTTTASPQGKYTSCPDEHESMLQLLHGNQIQIGIPSLASLQLWLAWLQHTRIHRYAAPSSNIIVPHISDGLFSASCSWAFLNTSDVVRAKICIYR